MSATVKEMNRPVKTQNIHKITLPKKKSVVAIQTERYVMDKFVLVHLYRSIHNPAAEIGVCS